MTPYYAREGVRLYLGDARGILQELDKASIDLVLTDPPYGIACSKTGAETKGRVRHPGGFTAKSAAVISGDETIDGSWLAAVHRLLRVPGALYSFSRWDVDREWQSLIEAAGFKIKNRIIWAKANHGSGDLTGAFGYSHETLWRAVVGRQEIRGRRTGDVWHDQWTECIRHGKVHPFEKPVDLLERAVASDSDRNDTVLDPFTGSGSTGEACIRLGRKFIGIEIDERWCEHAAKRLDRILSEPRLPFVEESSPPAQGSLWE